MCTISKGHNLPTSYLPNSGYTTFTFSLLTILIYLLTYLRFLTVTFLKHVLSSITSYAISCLVCTSSQFSAPNLDLNNALPLSSRISSLLIHANHNNNNKKRSHTQLDSRKQVIAFQDRVITINIKEAQHPLKREKQVIDKSSIMLKISTKSMHRVLV